MYFKSIVLAFGKKSEVLDLQLKSMAPYTDLFNWVTPSLQLAHETDKFPKLSWSAWRDR